MHHPPRRAPKAGIIGSWGHGRGWRKLPEEIPTLSTTSDERLVQDFVSEADAVPRPARLGSRLYIWHRSASIRPSQRRRGMRGVRRSVWVGGNGRVQIGPPPLPSKGDRVGGRGGRLCTQLLASRFHHHLPLWRAKCSGGTTGQAWARSALLRLSLGARLLLPWSRKIVIEWTLHAVETVPLRAQLLGEFPPSLHAPRTPHVEQTGPWLLLGPSILVPLPLRLRHGPHGLAARQAVAR
jgi:hypothetical protein